MAVNGELKDTATAGDQGERRYPITVPLKNFLRQTGGPGKIVSLYAVFQTDLHSLSILILACTTSVRVRPLKLIRYRPNLLESEGGFNGQETDLLFPALNNPIAVKITVGLLEVVDQADPRS